MNPIVKVGLVVAAIGAGGLIAYKYGLPKLKKVAIGGLFKLGKGSI